jgi:DNA-binding NarL/FixJ family response regulator
MLIEMQPGLELVGAAAAPDLAIDLFIQERPDLTIMDLDLPSSGGVEAIHRIRQIDPSAWVIAMTTDDSTDCGARAIEAGATAVLAKHVLSERLVPLILEGRESVAAS